MNTTDFISQALGEFDNHFNSFHDLDCYYTERMGCDCGDINKEVKNWFEQKLREYSELIPSEYPRNNCFSEGCARCGCWYKALTEFKK